VRLRHPVVRGHPLHAIVTDVPITLLPLALAASVAARVRPSRETRFADDSVSRLALASLVPAVLLGWWDWLTIPKEHEARSPATLHGLVNTAAATCVLAAVWRPRRAELLGLAVALIAVGGWLGGDLVYALGWRVRKAELYEQLEEGKSPAAAEEAVREHERNDTFLASV